MVGWDGLVYMIPFSYNFPWSRNLDVRLTYVVLRVRCMYVSSTPSHVYFPGLLQAGEGFAKCAIALAMAHSLLEITILAPDFLSSITVSMLDYHLM